jgi:hypothetical protein
VAFNSEPVAGHERGVAAGRGWSGLAAELRSYSGSRKPTVRFQVKMAASGPLSMPILSADIAVAAPQWGKILW